jgi:hypothetical protein
MVELKRYDLDFDKSSKYFIDHINSGKFLSEKIVKTINFQDGSFFTLLPENANLEYLYNFPFGGILKGSVRVFNTPFSNAWSVPNIDKELSEFISIFLKASIDRISVFEDVIRKPKDPHVGGIHGIDVKLYGDEIYYFAKSNASENSILEAIQVTGVVWHFLAVLTQGNIPSKLSEQDFDTICENLSYVIAGAYDGEGYIIWERNGIKESKA